MAGLLYLVLYLACWFPDLSEGFTRLNLLARSYSFVCTFMVFFKSCLCSYCTLHCICIGVCSSAFVTGHLTAICDCLQHQCEDDAADITTASHDVITPAYDVIARACQALGPSAGPVVTQPMTPEWSSRPGQMCYMQPAICWHSSLVQHPCMLCTRHLQATATGFICTQDSCNYQDQATPAARHWLHVCQ